MWETHRNVTDDREPTPPLSHTVTRRGVVRLVPIFVGSRSERLGAVLESDDADEGVERIRLTLEGDDSLTGDGLRAFENRRVSVTGFVRQGLLRVASAENISIEQADDSGVPSDEPASRGDSHG